MSGTNLTREEALGRSSVISVDSYEVALDLSSRDETFASATTVYFRATPGTKTWIDYIAPSVESLTLNGSALDLGAHDGYRIALTNLAEENVLTVVGQSKYMHTGEGMHRFIDPVDDEVYLYTQFEIADARRVFACFDQPDLKATYQFTITAPNHWKVTSNSATPEPVAVTEYASCWSFEPTLPMSTYITAIVAGPYYEVRDEYVGVNGTIPLGLFCRNSLAEFLDPDDLFTVTKQGFEYFEDAFQTPYPFGKYDQLFVPEFNAGAMENAGCVTHHEDYVFRSKVTRAAYEQRANTVLHEMAHMWFGDLVTMKWWDDLWLNESFAEWAAHHASAKVTKYTEAWTNFVNQRKAWGYRQDQLPTTHPIVADMVDLDAVEVNFDGITYAKGASTLRQLVAWVGEDEFVAGLREYFRKHAWGNTELSDLLVELEKASGRELKDWTHRWLQTAGVNVISPDISYNGDTYGEVAVLQSPPLAPEGVAPTLRPHRIRIGLYNRVGDSIERVDSVEVDIDGPRTVIDELAGKAVADLLVLNDGDLTFVKIRLDERSAKTAVTGINQINDGVTRALIWGASWDMTRDAQMSTADYLALVNSADLASMEIGVVQQILLQARSAIEQFGSPEKRHTYRDDLFAKLSSHLSQSAPGGDHQLAFVRNMIAIARTPEQLTILQNWLNNADMPAGLDIDTDLRWSFVSKLVSSGVLPTSAIDDELDRDNTAGGQRQAAAARAAVATKEAKATAWAAVIESDDLPNALLDATIGGFASPDQRHLLTEYVDKYFVVLDGVWANRTNETAQSITTGFYPSLLASPEVLEKTDKYLETCTDAGAIRLVRELRDNVARSLRCQALDS